MIQQTSRRIGRGCAAMIVCLLTAAASIAQAGPAGSPQWSTEFAAPVVNGSIYAQAVFNDGTGAALYCGGQFTQIGGIYANNLAKWNGVTWSEVGGGVNGQVYALESFTFGASSHLFVGGSFGSVGTGASTLNANGVARWSGVAWSAAGTGLTNGGAVLAMAVHNAGAGNALYAGGNFGTAGGVAVSNIARWTGAVWQAVGSGLNGIVTDLETFTSPIGSHIYAAGNFAQSGATTVNSVARFTGSAWVSMAGGLNGAANRLAVHNDGTGSALYVSSNGFNIAGGTVSVNGVARWSGTAWSAVGSAPSQIVAMRSFDDGTGSKLWVSGFFSSVAGMPSGGVGAWDGFGWMSASTGAEPSNNSLATYDGGGGPQLWRGHQRRVAGQWISPGQGIDPNYVVAALGSVDFGSGTRLTATGSFYNAGTTQNGVLYDGTQWSATGTGGAVLFPSGIGGRALAFGDLGAGPRLFRGGDFNQFGPGVNIVGGVFSSDGTADVMLPGISQVNALALFDDGNGLALYAGGQGAGAIAKWDGFAWQPLGGGLLGGNGGGVKAMCVHDDGSGRKLYVGGSFVVSGSGVTLHNLGRWDGTTWSSVGNGVSGGSVLALAEYSAGGPPKLIVGGDFTSTGLTPRAALAAWDGSSFSDVGVVAPVPTAAPSVQALVVHDDGTGPMLYAGGFFTSIGASTQPALARWNGTTWSNVGGPIGGHAASPPAANNYGTVSALASVDLGGPSLFVGGNFSTAGGFASSKIARWSRPGPLLFGPTTAAVGDAIVYELSTPAPYTPYVLDATFAGSSPGVAIGGGLVIPMNPPWLNLQFGDLIPGAFVNAFGFSDGFGSATAAVTLPAYPFLAGLTLTASFATLDPLGPFGVGTIAPARATTFFAADPTPVSVTPPFGSSAGGRNVVVYGAGFTAGSTVRFNGVAATSVVVAGDGASLTCLTPPGTTGDALIRVVSANGGWGQAEGLYTYTNPLSVATISPTSAPAGAVTVVTGDGFQPGTAVDCGGVPATDVVVDMNSTPNTLTFTRPAGVPCGGVLTVSLPDGQMVAGAFNPIPTALVYFNTTGPVAGGEQLFIVGGGFAPGTVVTIGGAQATLLSSSSTALLCAAPPGIVGNAPITVTSAAGCAAANIGNYIYY